MTNKSGPFAIHLKVLDISIFVMESSFATYNKNACNVKETEKIQK